MNSSHSRLQIIERMLRMIGNSQYNSAHLLKPDEFDRYRNYLVRAGLATVDNDEGCIGYLRPTPKGKALLLLIDRIESLGSSNEEEDESEYEEELSVEACNQARTETIEWRARIFQAYVLEQAELTRLRAQLNGPTDGEGEIELEEHERRLEIYQNLLYALDRLARES